MRFLKIWPIYLLIILTSFSVLPETVTANGAPVKIFLNYLPEISNYGPTNASGIATVSVGEAWVDLEIEGLPQLDGLQYEAWLVTTDNEMMISVGTFNSDADGKVDYYAEFDNIPLLEYRFFVISAEPDPDPNPEQADPRRSIAGVFPNTRLEVVIGTPTPTLGPGITPTPGAPASLPVTGTMNFAGLAAVIWVGLGMLLVGAGIVLKRKST